MISTLWLHSFANCSIMKTVYKELNKALNKAL